MNILFITAQLFTPQMVGGLQSSVIELALSLKRNGHKVSVLSSLTSKGILGLRGRLFFKLLRWKAAPDNTVGFPAWRAWFPWEAVDWLVKRLKPELVIVLARQPALMASAARAAGVPVLMMLQDVDFTDHGADFSLLGNVPCVANSQFTADRYRQAFGVEPVVIPPLIDAQKKYKTETTRENVTFINPHPIKGLEIALEVARQCPDIPFSFVEAWPMWPEERRDMEEKLAAVPNITLIPRVEDMREVYSKCKILLAPSVCEEAYGRVVTEAQFSGIPVVASNRGGLPEAVGQGGVVLDPEGDISNWVIAVRRLWHDDAYYKALSAAALAHADRPALKWDTQSGMWEKIIAAAASSRHKGGVNDIPA